MLEFTICRFLNSLLEFKYVEKEEDIDGAAHVEVIRTTVEGRNAGTPQQKHVKTTNAKTFQAAPRTPKNTMLKKRSFER